MTLNSSLFIQADIKEPGTFAPNVIQIRIIIAVLIVSSVIPTHMKVKTIQMSSAIAAILQEAEIKNEI